MVTQLLLLPVVYTLLGTAGRLLVGIPAAALVITCFLLLISEPSRTVVDGAQSPGRSPVVPSATSAGPSRR